MRRKHALALIYSLLVLITSTEGSVVINIYESEGNVVAEGGGELDFSALSLVGTTSGFSAVNPSGAALTVGEGVFSGYEVISGSSSFGSGGITVASSSAGDLFGVGASGNLLVIPVAYISGEELVGSATWESATLEGLGLEVGVYSWSWGSGGSLESLTVNVIPVPEPSVQMFLGLFLGCVLLSRIRR